MEPWPPELSSEGVLDWMVSCWKVWVRSSWRRPPPRPWGTIPWEPERLERQLWELLRDELRCTLEPWLLPDETLVLRSDGRVVVCWLQAGSPSCWSPGP